MGAAALEYEMDWKYRGISICLDLFNALEFAFDIETHYWRKHGQWFIYWETLFEK